MDFSEDRTRLTRPEMSYYSKTYAGSTEWQGQDLAGRRLLVYCEQGLGDILQFVRYVPLLGGEVWLHCPRTLHRLLAPLCHGVLDKSDPALPDHDYHVLSLSLPFRLGSWEAPVPYLRAGRADVLAGVGVCWEGNPDHPLNAERSCPLAWFAPLAGPLYMLHDRIHEPSLWSEDVAVHRNGFGGDMLATAELVRAMRFVVSVDTSVLHLAGALGVPALGLLADEPDHRWFVRNWYPSVKLVRGRKNWPAAIRQAENILKEAHD